MATLFHWMTLFAFWLILSGVFDLKHIIIGLLATMAVAASNRRLGIVEGGESETRALHLASVSWRRAFSYSLWLLRAIASANLHIARVVLDPRLPIDPALVRVPIRVSSDIEIALLANSITATPGTVTVRAADEENHEFIVHALVDSAGVPAAVREIEDHLLSAVRGEKGSS